MDETSVASRDRDPIEVVLFFLLKNWILLLSLPVAAGVIAFAMTLGTPQTFTGTLRIPAPPYALGDFDDLWRSAESPYKATVSADGSLLIDVTAASEQQAREPLAAAQAATQVVALKAIAFAEERRDKLSDFESRLISQPPASDLEVLVPQAYALAALVPSAENERQKTSNLRLWSRTLGEQKIGVSINTQSSRTVPFAIFGAFTLALVLAIARLLASRARNRRLSG